MKIDHYTYDYCGHYYDVTQFTVLDKDCVQKIDSNQYPFKKEDVLIIPTIIKLFVEI